MARRAGGQPLDRVGKQSVAHRNRQAHRSWSTIGLPELPLRTDYNIQPQVH